MTNIRATFINIALVSLFAFLSAWISAPLVSEMRLNAARRYEEKHRWRLVDNEIARIPVFSRSDAELHSQIAALYLRRAAILKDNIRPLSAAAAEYKEAVRINPYNVRDLTALGATEIQIFSEDNARYHECLGSAIGHFKSALNRDPRNHVVNFDIGRNLLSVWDYLGEEERRFAIDRFKYCMGATTAYRKRIYNLLWRKLKDFDIMAEVTPQTAAAYERLYGFLKANNLWNERQKIMPILEMLQEKEAPEVAAEKISQKKVRPARIKEGITIPEGAVSEFIALTDWQGTADDGKKVYKKGNMYWSGRVDRVIYLPGGARTVSVKARGTQAGEVWPYMVVELDGDGIGGVFVDSAEWADYRFDTGGKEGVRVLSVSFMNDGSNKAKKEDRNLYLGEAGSE